MRSLTVSFALANVLLDRSVRLLYVDLPLGLVNGSADDAELIIEARGVLAIAD